MTLLRNQTLMQEHNEVWVRLMDLHHRRVLPFAGRFYREGLAHLQLSWNEVPDIDRLARRLRKRTGWMIEPVETPLPSEKYFRLLSQRIFPCLRPLRSRSAIGFARTPDLFHDVVGHIPSLANRRVADIYQRFGEAADGASQGTLKVLESVHTFTMEFGLIRENGKIRLLGAGLLSSFAETERAFSGAVPIRLFDPKSMVNQQFHYSNFQECYFVCLSFSHLGRWIKHVGLLQREATKPADSPLKAEG